MEKLLGQLYPEDTGDISKVLGGGRSVDVDIDMLDYGFVEKCKDPVQLEAILEVLR